MFLLQLLPTSMLIYFVNLIFYVGVACTLFGFVFRFKFFEQWRLIIQVVGVLALGAGLYMKGGYEVESQWRARVAELEGKLALAEVKSQAVNTVIQEKIVEKIKVRKENVIKTVTVYKETAGKQLDKECTFNRETIDLLNSAAAGKSLVLTIPTDSDK